MLTVYAYEKCDTCRKALKWLDAHGIPHRVKAIRETPPNLDELKSALAASGGDIRRLFNTSGMDYRAMGLKDRLPDLTEAQALDLLTQHGNLVKRPFAIDGKRTLVGFRSDEWQAALART